MKTILIAVACCLLAAGLEFVIGTLAQPQPQAQWIFYASLVPALLIFCAGLCVMYLLSYVGVAMKNAPKGHRFRRPQRNELERLSGLRTAGVVQR